jgi:hypothetical protein
MVSKYWITYTERREYEWYNPSVSRIEAVFDQKIDPRKRWGFFRILKFAEPASGLSLWLAFDVGTLTDPMNRGLKAPSSSTPVILPAVTL